MRRQVNDGYVALALTDGDVALALTDRWQLANVERTRQNFDGADPCLTGNFGPIGASKLPCLRSALPLYQLCPAALSIAKKKRKSKKRKKKREKEEEEKKKKKNKKGGKEDRGK